MNQTRRKRQSKFYDLKRIIAIVLCLTMIITACPFGTQRVHADGGNNSGKKTVTVYFTLSEDGKFVTGKDDKETVLAHIPVTITYFDLAEYGLEDYYRYESQPFEDGGEYIFGSDVIEQPTLLHLYIKMLEKYYLGDGSKLVVNDGEQDALSVSGSPTSLYMTRFWGHDENLMYYVNHKYPLQAAGWGSTCDYILLEDGMEIDVAMFSDWDFYHTGAFAYFTSDTNTMNKDGCYETGVNENVSLTMRATATNAAYDGNSSFFGKPMAGEDVVYCNSTQATADYTNKTWKDSFENTDKDGKVNVSFSKPGTYYVSSTPLYKEYSLDSGNPCVAPPIAVIKVYGDKPQETETQKEYDGNLIENIGVASGVSVQAPSYDTDTEFSNAKTDYVVTVPDYEDSVCINANLVENAPKNTKITAVYRDVNGNETSVELNAEDEIGKKLPKIINKGIGKNTFEIKAQWTGTDGRIVKENYRYSIVRKLSLNDINLKNPHSGKDVVLAPLFEKTTDLYEINVSENTENIELNMSRHSFGNYDIYVNGEKAEEDTVNVKLKDGVDEQIKILVTCSDAKEQEYVINVKKTKYVTVEFDMTPDSNIQIVDSNGENVIRTVAHGDKYTSDAFLEGEEYTYTITKYGYNAKTGTFRAKDGEKIDGVIIESKENSNIDTAIKAQWPNFRGNKDNNAVTEGLTPTDYTNAQLYWAKKVGTGYGSGAPSSPILVDDCLVYTTATTIVKVDTVTGDVVAKGNMVKTSAFNITPPTYADGMIFVALASGTIQAFNAKTLESLWVYEDPLFGQPNSPVTYKNGYIYTGFWNGETGNANYVCLSATDEDTTNTTEKKTATWRYTSKGGFYWAGCYVNDRFLVVGTDDGKKTDEPGKSKLLVLDSMTGNVIDKYENIEGDTRSTVCYDQDTKRYYCTSKGGDFYSFEISEDGIIKDEKCVKLGSASTSTPVVYNKRAYVGVKGKEQFGVNTGHHISVIDLETMEEAYTLSTRGYPQTSGLVTTAYGNNDGYTYVYFVDNYEPGKIRVLKDRKGQTEPIITRDSEYDDDKDYNVLFSPKGEQANYAICSLISDRYGTIYFKNDSAYMMALGSKIEKIEVTKQPDKTNYKEGEYFNPKGMEVTATYANGKKRDITKYVTYSNEKLTEDMSDIEIRFPYVMYNDTLKNYEKFDPLLDTVEITVNTKDGVQKAEQVVKKIDEIGSTITLDSKEKIKAARKSYDALTSSEEVYVTNYSKLLAAENTFKELVKTEFGKNKIKLNAKEQKQSFVSISFNKNKYADGYIIYRWNEESKKYEKIKTLTATGYKDKDVKIGNTYSYKVEQYVEMGPFGKTIISSQSNICKVNITLEKPKLTGKIKLKKATVKWKKNAKASGYEIFRKTGKKGKYKKIKTIKTNKTTKFTDTKIKKKKTYYYKIRAYRTVSKKKVYSEFSKNCTYKKSSSK